jgi:hypothetical protein
MKLDKKHLWKVLIIDPNVLITMDTSRFASYLDVHIGIYNRRR